MIDPVEMLSGKSSDDVRLTSELADARSITSERALR